MIIAIEGLDASGKATQAKAVAQELQPSTVISFPRYDGPFGEIIKGHLHERLILCGQSEQGVLSPSKFDPVVFQSLMTSDKYDAASEIEALDRKGQCVVLDRYWPSACCYGADDGLDFGSMLKINSRLPPADLYVLLDISVEKAAGRRPKARDRYERDKEKLARIRDRYLYMWELMVNRNVAGSRWVVLNGHCEAKEITRIILNHVKDITDR
ncbi:Tmk Thymidylate kinase [uncultured Caudovirales phage]|uniref:dTMP kinase n=1 Tax=uncultured Caudovirales phage TaxID=2100421 RepID=A0A6J5LDD0_9CAUD|nr:Tmk Thymidylate kinase [uncultured Caudovirales phage]CAB4135223.1 Tmk Thymidylate kinase [uncultured Caudovirales phage]